MCATGTGCKPDGATRPPDAAPPATKPIVLDGWPGPFVPELKPTRDLKVTMRADSDPAAETTAICELPEGRVYGYARSRVVASRPGRLVATSSTSASAVRFGSVAEANARAAQRGTPSRLDIPAGGSFPIVAMLGGRCLIDPGVGGAVWAIPCPTPKLKVESAPEQAWWLEGACSRGEGWFEVRDTDFSVESYPLLGR